MPSRLEVLDLLRGIAAISVALFHFTGNLAPSLFKSLCSYGWLGVEMFFVISGFIIPYSLARGRYNLRTDYARFLLKRTTRLHPAYLASIILFLGLWYFSAILPGFLGEAPDLGAGQILSHLLLTTQINGFEWIQPVYWTLAIEFQFYVFIALVFPLVVASSKAIRWLSLGGIVSLALLPVSKIWFLPYLPLFLLGILVFLHLQGKLPIILFLITLLATSLLTYFTLGIQQASVGLLTATAIAFTRVSVPPALVWPGMISYSLYLVHLPIGGRLINLSKRIGIDEAWFQYTSIAAALVASVICAHIFYICVERPSQKWSSAIRFNRSSKSIPSPGL